VIKTIVVTLVLYDLYLDVRDHQSYTISS